MQLFLALLLFISMFILIIILSGKKDDFKPLKVENKINKLSL